MNAKLLIQKTRLMIAKTRDRIQISKIKYERSLQRSIFADPKEAKRVHQLLFGGPIR